MTVRVPLKLACSVEPSSASPDRAGARVPTAPPGVTVAMSRWRAHPLSRRAAPSRRDCLAQTIDGAWSRRRDGRRGPVADGRSRRLGRGLEESPLEDLIDVLDQDQLHRLLDLVRYLGQVLAVLFGQDERLDASAVGGQHLFLQAANGQHLAAQGDLPGHCDVAAYRAFG